MRKVLAGITGRHCRRAERGCAETLFRPTLARLRRHFGQTRMMLATRSPSTRCTCHPCVDGFFRRG